jgi:hypothetical protein
LDQRGRKWQKAGEDCKMRSFITCPSPNIIRVIKPRKMRWAGHVTRMGDMRNAHYVLLAWYLVGAITSISSYVLMAWYLVKYRDFTFILRVAI